MVGILGMLGQAGEIESMEAICRRKELAPPS